MGRPLLPVPNSFDVVRRPERRTITYGEFVRAVSEVPQGRVLHWVFRMKKHRFEQCAGLRGLV